MRIDSELNITLPGIVAQVVRARLASGRYASASEGLRALADQEQAVENWLGRSILADYANWEAGTLETTGLEEYRDELVRDRAERE